MTDYNKLTVANLRQLLKDRSIPSTGLTRKAQIVEKLEEQDRANEETKQDASEQGDVPDGPDPANNAQDGKELGEGDGDAQMGESVVDVGAQSAQPAQPPVEEPPVEEPPVEEPPVEEPPVEEPPVEEPVPEPPAAPMDQEAAQSEVDDGAAAEADEEQSMDTESSSERAAEETVVPTVAVEDSVPPTTASTTETVAAQEIETSAPALDPGEKLSVEKPELLPIPEQSANASMEASRLNTEEAEADTKKRKRRSGSPELPAHDIKAKKPRPSDEIAPHVHLDEDTDVVMTENAPESVEQSVSRRESLARDETKPPVTESNAVEAQSTDTSVPPSKPLTEPKYKATRYKDLFSPIGAAPALDMPISSLPKSGALHPATPALYIRDLMRPLRPDALRNHIIALAAPPSAEPDPEAIKTLFLDNMRTHAFVLFTTANAASRVRAAMHGTVWPPEGNRKQLFVDFVPAEKVESWIRDEEDAIIAEKEARAGGRSMNAKKFEVVYEQGPDGIEAIFQELGASAPLNAPKGPKGLADRKPSFNDGFGTTPAASTAPPQTNPPVNLKPSQSSFQTLDSLFLSTSKSKPLLYFKEVPADVATARKRVLDSETSRDWDPDARVRGRGRGRLDEKCKFGFDREDRLVEVGVDHGPWSETRQEGGGRGGYGGDFRGNRGGRGAWRGGDRGGRGGWRGRGGADRW